MARQNGNAEPCDGSPGVLDVCARPKPPATAGAVVPASPAASAGRAATARCSGRTPPGYQSEKSTPKTPRTPRSVSNVCALIGST